MIEMMTLTIATNALRQTIRGRAVFAVGAYLILLPLLAIPGGYVAIGQERKILVDVGLALITLIGVFFGVIWGTGQGDSGGDLDSLALLFSKPVRRWQIVLGRFVGLVAAQTLTTVTMGALLVLAHLRFVLMPIADGKDAGHNADLPGGWSLRLWIVIGLVFLEILIVTALALLFRELTNQPLAVILTLLLTLIGRSATELPQLAEKMASPVVGGIFRVAYYLVPNLASLNYLATAGYDGKIPPGHLGGHIIYAVLVILVINFLTMVVFERREIK
ncbi:MAG: hypothetical protein EBU88_01750 [Acidobacteria bacterium]|nr:hypothetical protein [Acidobacteriota bacterium]